MENEVEFITQLIHSNQRDAAFSKLLDLYQVKLYWLIRKIVLNHEDANDVLQNTFIRIYKGLPNFAQDSSLYTWMHKIAYRESLRLLEQNKKNTHLAIDDLSSTYLNNLKADSFFEGTEIQLKLHQILAKLPEKQREIFNFKYYDELKFREIAALTGINESTIKTTYYATLNTIQSQIENLAHLHLSTNE